MKKAVKTALRFLGYEIRRLPQPLPADLREFIRANSRDLELAPVGRSPAGATAAPKPFIEGKKSLIVEGWRFHAHSYAVVNQWQLLALARRPDMAIRIRDKPFLNSQWKAQADLFTDTDEATLQRLGPAASSDSADVTLRTTFPFDFSTSNSGITAVFGTTEYQTLQPDMIRDPVMFDAIDRREWIPDVRVITPSRWSANGFYRAGFDEKQVLIIPHGVDLGLFRPDPMLRAEVRRKLSIPEGAFVFLTVGAMTSNKGIDLLLKAFIEVSRTFPHARLVLKGLDSLYGSKDLLISMLQKIPPHERGRVLKQMVYLGKSMSFRELAALYCGADAYMSPYRAEGFNLPVLEAAACGLPVLCTMGGPTDDFVLDSFARRVESRLRPFEVNGRELVMLEPDLEHLTALMRSVVDDHEWRKEAAVSARAHAAARFTWDHIVDALVTKLWS